MAAAIVVGHIVEPSASERLQSPTFSAPRGLYSRKSVLSSPSRVVWSSKIVGPAKPLNLSTSRKPLTIKASRGISGKCFVVRDNIDTDQIIPAEYLTLVPSKADEYEKLGSYAMCGLPAEYERFIEEGKSKTKYPVIIAGYNFGCGSSREHAPVALGAAGVKAVVAESYARIFFRNSVATGELYPVESEARICDEFSNGDDVTVDFDKNLLVNNTTGKCFALKPLGDAAPVIDAGGIFAYARKAGMIPASA